MLAAVLIAAAAYLLWRDITDWAFVCGVLAACSYFLSVRFRIRSRMAEHEAVDDDQEDNYDLLEPADDSTPLTADTSKPNSTLNR